MVLDVLLERDPHARAAVRLLAYVERQGLTGLLGATTITTVHYLSRKALGGAAARTQIEVLLRLFEVAPVTRPVLEGALDLEFPDFEDAAPHHCISGARDVVVVDELKQVEDGLPNPTFGAEVHQSPMTLRLGLEIGV